MAPKDSISPRDSHPQDDGTPPPGASVLSLADPKTRAAFIAALKNPNAGSELPVCNLAAQVMEKLDGDGQSYIVPRKGGPFHALASSGLSIDERILAASCINERHKTTHLTGMPPYAVNEILPTGPAWLKPKEEKDQKRGQSITETEGDAAPVRKDPDHATVNLDAQAANSVTGEAHVDKTGNTETKAARVEDRAPAKKTADDPVVVDPKTSGDRSTDTKAVNTAPPVIQQTGRQDASPPRPLPEKLWNPEDAAQPTIDLFNQGKVVEATASLKALQDDAAHREVGAWRHEIEFLNSKVDSSKLNMQDYGQIMGVDKSGNLITASADLSKEQTRLPASPQKPNYEFDFWMPSYTEFGGAVVDPAGADQVDRVSQYKKDIEAAKALHVSPEQMQIKDNVTPIVDAFKSGDLANATEKLKALQDADKPQEPQMWLRHIQAVNANLDFSKLGLKDVGQIVGVDENGKLLTASADLKLVQTRDTKSPDQIEKSENPNPYIWPFNRLFGDGKTTDQIASVKESMDEAKEARLEKLGPGWHHVSLTSDGEQREADIYVGKGVDASKPAPLAYVLHGAGPPPERDIMENETHASRWADANNAIVVYPFAEEHSQPVGNLGGILGALSTFTPNMDYHAWQTMPNSGLNETRLTYDDTHYLKALDDQVGRQLNVDQTRKIMFVFSDGGTISKNGAVAIGASAVIENHAGIKSDFQLPTNSGIAYYAVNGEADEVMPRAGASVYNGFLGNWEARWPKLSLSDPTRNFYEFAVANGCSGTPLVTKSANMIRTEYLASQCKTNMPVVENNFPKDYHQVPNPEPTLANYKAAPFLGSKNTKFDSFATMADEALKHPKGGS